MIADSTSSPLSQKEDPYKKGFYFLSFCAFVFMLSYRLILAFYPTPNTGGAENNIIYFVQRILSGQTIYSDPSEAPYAIAQYTPLYYYLLAALAKLTATSPDDVLKLFVINRITSLFLHLSLSFFAGLALKRLTKLDTNFALVTGFLVFVFLQPSSRPDNLSILLWFCSLWFFVRSLDVEKFPRPGKHYWLSAIFGILAVLAKQSAITILLLIPGWLIFKRSYWQALYYLSIAAALGMMVMIMGSIFYDIDIAFKNIVCGIDNGTSLSYYASVFLGYYGENIFLLAVAVVIGFLLWDRNDSFSRLLVWMMAGQFLLSNIFGLKVGSGTNYLMEWLVLVVIGTSLCAERLKEMLAIIRPRLAHILLSLAVIFYIVPAINSLYWYSRKANFKSSKQDFLEEKAVADYVNAGGSEDHYYVLTTVSTPGSYLSNLCRERLLMPQSDIINTVYDRHVFDYSRLRTQIENGEVRYIVTKQSSDTIHFLDFQLSNYSLDTTIRRYRVYVRKSKMKR